jgi:hypothetical protein
MRRKKKKENKLAEGVIPLYPNGIQKVNFDEQRLPGTQAKVLRMIIPKKIHFEGRHYTAFENIKKVIETRAFKKGIEYHQSLLSFKNESDDDWLLTLLGSFGENIDYIEQHIESCAALYEVIKSRKHLYEK